MPESPKPSLLTTGQLLQKQRQGAVVLDTRTAEEFASLHIRGAIQIGLTGSFASWAAILLKPTQKLVLVVKNATSAEEACSRLERVGLRQLAGYSLADEEQWRKEGINLASLSIQRCEDIRNVLLNDPSLQLVDVRSRAEWLKGHLPGAISVPLLHLDLGAQRIDSSKPALVYCHEGYRATTAASVLRRKSADTIAILIDGVEGWLACGLPLEMPKTL